MLATPFLFYTLINKGVLSMNIDYAKLLNTVYKDEKSKSIPIEYVLVILAIIENTLNKGE